MADQRLRELERRALTGDVEARDQLAQGRFRAAQGRDPRVDPQPGDMVMAGPKRTTRVVDEILPPTEEARRWGPDGPYLDQGRRCVSFTVLRRNRFKGGVLGAGVPFKCLLTSWQRWARGGQVLRVAEASVSPPE